MLYTSGLDFYYSTIMTSLAPVYDEEGYDIYRGYDKFGFNREGYSMDGFDKYGVNKEGKPYEYIKLNGLHQTCLWYRSDRTEADRKRIHDINIIYSSFYEGYICPICNGPVNIENNGYCNCK